MAAARMVGDDRGAGSPPLTPTLSPARSSGGAQRTLLEAASLGDGAAVARLLEQGVAAEDCDGDGWTALVRAAAAGHEAIVRLLLDRGASVVPLFTQGHEAARRQASRSGRSTPLHYKELFGEASIVSMLVVAAAAQLPSAKLESAAKLLRSAEYGRVLLYLRALQPQANQKVIAARLAAQPTTAAHVAPRDTPVKGAWSVSYDQFVRDAGISVAREILLHGRPYQERRILPPAPTPRPPAPFKHSLPPNLICSDPLLPHDPVQTGAHWYSNTDGTPTELEGVVSTATQMPETPVKPGAEWSTDPQPTQLVIARCHPDLLVQQSASVGPLAATTMITRVRDSLWESSHRKGFGVAVASHHMAEGRHYMECRAMASANSGFLLGVAQSHYDPSKDPKFAGSMWAFDAFDGSLFHNQRSYKWNGMEPSVQGDIIGIHLDSDRGLLTIYKNGKKLGVMCGGLYGETLSWVVPLWDVGDSLHLTPLSKPTREGQALPLSGGVSMAVKANDAARQLHLNCEDKAAHVSARSKAAPRRSVVNQKAEQQRIVPVDETTAIKELSEVQAQSILDAEAFRARPQILQKLRNQNEQALHVAQEAAVENKKLLDGSGGQHPEHVDTDMPSAGNSVSGSEGPSKNSGAGQHGFQEEANFQLARFLSFSEKGAITLLIPKLSEICRKILNAMTTRQLVNLAQRRHVSIIDCPMLTKTELQNLVQKTAAVPEKELYVDLDSVRKEFRQRLHYYHRSPSVTRPELMRFLKELGADPARYFDKQKIIKKLTEHWAGRELKKLMLSDRSRPIPRTGQELAKDPAALVLSRTEWLQKLEHALGWIAPGTLFVAVDNQISATVGLPDRKDDLPTSGESKNENANGFASCQNATSTHIELSRSIQDTADNPTNEGVATVGSNRMRTGPSLGDVHPSDTSQLATDASSDLEAELRSLVMEAQDAAIKANSAAISIVKRVASAPHQQSKVVDAGTTSVSTTDEISNQTLILKVKRQEQQILRLNQQLEDIRVDLDNANRQAALRPPLSIPVSGKENAEEHREQQMASDPLKESEFRAAASKNEISKMKTLKDSVNIDAADCDGTDHIFSKTALQGFTALHHAVFGEHGPSLDAMVLLLQWGCKMDIEDAAGITARGYAVDPRAANLLDLVSTPYVACEGDPGFDDPGLLPKLPGTMSPADTVRVLLSEVWPARLARAEMRAAILEAAAVGDEDALEAALGTAGLLDDSVVNCVDGFGQTALCWAAHQGHMGVIQKLLRCNADVAIGSSNHAKESNPTAAVRGNFLSPRGTPFLNACRTGHPEIARILSSNGVDRTQLEHAAMEMSQQSDADPHDLNRVFCHWVPQLRHLDADAEQRQVKKGREEVKQLLKEIHAEMHNVDLDANNQNKKSKARLRSKSGRLSGKTSKNSRRKPRLRSSSPEQDRGVPTLSGDRSHAQVTVALTSQSGMQAMLLSPTTLSTLSATRTKELAIDYEKKALQAAQVAADGAVAVAAYIKENGRAPPDHNGDDLKPKPPDEPHVGSAPRFTKFHRELRLSSNGHQVEKKRSTIYGQWRTALCAGSKMVMRRGGGGVPEDYYADFTIRSATSSERRLGDAEGRSGLETHPHHNNHHHHRALPRHITIGVAHRKYNPNSPGRGTSSRQCWGYSAHSGMCRHAGRTFDWEGRHAAVPGDTVGLHLRLPNEGDGGGTLSVFLNGQLLGEMCEVPPGEYVWMVENGDPGESVTVRAAEPATNAAR